DWPPAFAIIFSSADLYLLKFAARTFGRQWSRFLRTLKFLKAILLESSADPEPDLKRKRGSLCVPRLPLSCYLRKTGHGRKQRLPGIANNLFVHIDLFCSLPSLLLSY
ncbi:hypothetical protein DFH08DRAFT_943019, partial [Mycena albidolilacea]